MGCGPEMGCWAGLGGVRGKRGRKKMLFGGACEPHAGSASAENYMNKYTISRSSKNSNNVGSMCNMSGQCA